MSVKDELARFRGMKGAMGRAAVERERGLFPTIGTRMRAVPRTEVLPAGRRRARRGIREDVLLELEEFHGGPRRAVARDNGGNGYDFVAGEGLFSRLFGQREPRSDDEARRQVHDLRVAIERARENIARARTRIAGEERKVSDAEAEIRRAEERIGRLQRAFELERTDRTLMATAALV